MSNYRNNDIEYYSSIFKALSNPHRLSIFMQLAKGSVCGIAEGCEDQICTCVGELGKDLGIAPSTISHHLKELNRVGLIRMKRRGQSVDCSINPEAIDIITSFIEGKEPASV